MLDLPILITIGLFLAMVSVIDIKTRLIPAILLTTAIFTLVVYTIYQNEVIGLYMALYGFIIAWIFYELDMFKGRADFKVIVIITLTLTTLLEFFTFIVLIAGFNVVYTLLFAKILLKKKNEEIPFIPMFFAVYLTLILLSLI